MESVKVKLVKPVKFGSEDISEVTVRKPKAKDLRKFPAKAETLGQMLDFAAGLCALTPSQIDELELEDAMKIFEVITDFLPDGLKTGPSK